MVSTLKLTKIQIPNSDSDVLSFNSSTGIMTFHKDIKGEGTNTTNLQQGLCKTRGNIDGDAGTAVLHSGSDSLNVGGITDVAQGRYTVTMTNNFANAFYQQANHAGYRDDANGQDYGMTLGTYAYASKTTSENPLAMTYTNGSHYECDHAMFTFFGDLA